MKKSIFDLSFMEGFKLQLNVSKTSYYRQYVKNYILTIFIVALVSFSYIKYISKADENLSTICYIIIFCFVGLTGMICSYKRFDLMKQYFEEKNK